MSSIQELRFHIRSIKNISQVTGALETVSTSKVRRLVQAYKTAKPYAEKSWKVLLHLARQPGHTSLHPLLSERSKVNKVLVILITSDRGLAGAYNINLVRHVLQKFENYKMPVSYIAIGKKGRDMLIREGEHVLAEFSNIPSPPSFIDVSAVGYLVVNEFLMGEYDQVFLAYTRFVNMTNQDLVVRKLLPLDVQYDETQGSFNITHQSQLIFEYEPNQIELLDEIIPRFTSWQIFAGVLSAHASEHAQRRMAMHNAKSNANELISDLKLEYNKARQRIITDDILDIAAGTETINFVE